MQTTPQPSGLVAAGAYRWNAGLGDWDFDPSPGTDALEIYHRTAGASFSASDLRFSRIGDDLFINVPELTQRLRLKGWYVAGSWDLEHLKYRSADSFHEVTHGSFERKTFSEVLPPDLPDLAKRGLAPVSPAESTPDGSGVEVSHAKEAKLPSEPTAAPEGKKGAAVGVLRGTAKDDELTIGVGSEAAKTRGGDDTIHVQHLSQAADPPDNKHIDGGSGNDTADYLGAFKDPKAGIEVSLAKQTVKWGAGGVDKLASIENIGGTDATDRFEGSKKDNVMTGYRGDDWYKVRLGGGNDTIVDEDNTAGNSDTLEFGKGIQLEQLTGYTSRGDVVIEISREDGSFGGSVTIKNGVHENFAIENFLLSSGKRFTLDDIALPQPAVL